MKKLIFWLVAVVLVVAPIVVLASTFDAGNSIYIPSAQTLSGNTYLAGGEVTVSSPALKDLIVAGGRVIVNAPVWGDALLAGGSVDILNQVAGDVRATGGQITISGIVGGDLIVLGGAVTVNQGATIAGDVIAIAGTVTLNGTVNGSVRLYAGEVNINSTIAGPVIMQIAEHATFGPSSVLGSSLSYAAPAEAVVAQGAKLGQSIHFTKRDIPGTESIDKLSGTVLAVFGVLVLIKFVSLLISALIVTMVFKDFTLELSERTVKKFWMKAGVGFIVLVVGPVAMFALAISFVGLYLALLLGLLYGLVLVIAGIYSCILTGALLSRFIKKEVRVNWKWTVLGTVVLFAVSFVPFIGWVACAFVYCASIGAIAMSVMRDAKGKMHLPA